MFSSTSTDARSLMQWLLEFRPQDRPNLEQIIKHPWLKSAGKSPHSPSNNQTTSVAPSHQTTKRQLMSPSNSRVSPSATKHHQSPTSPSRCQKDTVSSSPMSHSNSGSRGAGTPSSPCGRSSSSYFTPPQGRTGVKYTVPKSGTPSPDNARGGCVASSSGLVRAKNGALGCCLPSVVSARNVSPSSQSGHSSGGGRGPTSLHRVSPGKSSKSVLRQFVSPVVPPSRGPTSHYVAYCCNGGTGTTLQAVTGTRGGGGGEGGVVQPEASRTQLLVSRKQAF